MGLSVITLTKNEEHNIAECLESVRWADQIIVIDSGSTDRTVEIARRYTDCIYEMAWAGYGEMKNIALSKATQDWVLWIDADERVPADLGEEIRSVMTGNGQEHAGYEVARRAFFLGKWIRHCGWYPGYVTRLFRRERARFSVSRVHERLELEGATGRLENDLLHFTDRNLHHYFSKFNRYTSLAAEDLAEEGRAFSFYDVVVRPPFLFLKMYLFRLGFLDGMRGLILSFASASYVFVKYAKLWELRRVDIERGGKP